MFILNGIVYASERPENIEITQATPLEDMMMILTFCTLWIVFYTDSFSRLYGKLCSYINSGAQSISSSIQVTTPLTILHELNTFVSAKG